MEQLTKNQAVATSQEAVQSQNEPQLRDENAHNDKSVHGVLNPTYQAGLRRDAVQPDIEAERKKRDEIEAGKSYCSLIILIKQELLLLVYELNRSGLLAENEKIRPILAQLEKLLLCDLSPSTNDSVKN